MKPVFDFSEALRRLKNGEAVARQGWNGKGMYIYLVKGTAIKAHELRNEAEKHVGSTKDELDIVNIGSHIDMKAADGSVVVGWLCSQTDMLSEDWTTVN